MPGTECMVPEPFHCWWELVVYRSLGHNRVPEVQDPDTLVLGSFPVHLVDTRKKIDVSRVINSCTWRIPKAHWKNNPSVPQRCMREVFCFWENCKNPFAIYGGFHIST
jgi:hypothetical protein